MRLEAPGNPHEFLFDCLVVLQMESFVFRHGSVLTSLEVLRSSSLCPFFSCGRFFISFFYQQRAGDYNLAFFKKGLVLLHTQEFWEKIAGFRRVYFIPQLVTTVSEMDFFRTEFTKTVSRDGPSGMIKKLDFLEKTQPSSCMIGSGVCRLVHERVSKIWYTLACLAVFTREYQVNQGALRCSLSLSRVRHFWVMLLVLGQIQQNKHFYFLALILALFGRVLLRHRQAYRCCFAFCVVQRQRVRVRGPHFVTLRSHYCEYAELRYNSVCFFLVSCWPHLLNSLWVFLVRFRLIRSLWKWATFDQQRAGYRIVWSSYKSVGVMRYYYGRSKNI